MKSSRRAYRQRSRKATWWCACLLLRLPLGSLLTVLCLAQGLLLDLDAATLTVWINGERKGVMVRPGITNVDGEPVGRLEGPLRWAVDVRNSSLAIAGPLPPPA